MGASSWLPALLLVVGLPSTITSPLLLLLPTDQAEFFQKPCQARRTTAISTLQIIISFIIHKFCSPQHLNLCLLLYVNIQIKVVEEVLCN
ncbi:hypothetical protein GOP47_0018931 [Adiantum capillus-veneris]|uniref:Uncharacterized protein n=1 Tax=Adiantum capillus-veneris TaxID=13818 RepID=A0A9D4ZA28_ADICA|nr:hypothetical protein GOP47_0018931 [Adiantum capillus-veneris]